ncbi:hypothetical protein JCM6882_003515 [Rhodosporidiobolus microsporus]
MTRGRSRRPSSASAGHGSSPPPVLTLRLSSDPHIIGAISLVRRLEDELRPTGIWTLRAVPAAFDPATSLNLFLHELPTGHKTGDDPLFDRGIRFQWIGVEALCSDHAQKAAICQALTGECQVGSLPRCIMTYEGAAEKQSHTFRCSLRLENANGQLSSAMMNMISYDHGTDNHSNILSAHLGPDAALWPEWRTSIPTVDNYHRPLGCDLPVYTGAVLFVDFVSLAVMHHNDEPEQQEDFMAFNYLHHLVWARKLDKYFIPNFRGRDIEDFLSLLEPSRVEQYVSWAGSVLVNKEAVTKAYLKWWQGENGVLAGHVYSAAWSASEWVIEETKLLLEAAAPAELHSSAPDPTGPHPYDGDYDGDYTGGRGSSAGFTARPFAPRPRSARGPASDSYYADHTTYDSRPPPGPRARDPSSSRRARDPSSSRWRDEPAAASSSRYPPRAGTMPSSSSSRRNESRGRRRSTSYSSTTYIYPAVSPEPPHAPQLYAVPPIPTGPPLYTQTYPPSYTGSYPDVVDDLSAGMSGMHVSGSGYRHYAPHGGYSGRYSGGYY